MTGEVVYVLGVPDSLTVKIGTTNNLPKRVAEIQRMSPVPIELLWNCPGGHELETELHRHFKVYRAHGEWFTFHRNPIDLIRWAVDGEPWLRPKISLKKKVDAAHRAKKRTILTTCPTCGYHPAFDAYIEFATTFAAKLEAIPDLVERFEASREAEERGAFLYRATLREIAVEMKGHGYSWVEVGERMGGVSGQRAHQISKYPPFEPSAA